MRAHAARGRERALCGSSPVLNTCGKATTLDGELEKQPFRKAATAQRGTLFHRSQRQEAAEGTGWPCRRPRRSKRCRALRPRHANFAEILNERGKVVRTSGTRTVGIKGVPTFGRCEDEGTKSASHGLRAHSPPLRLWTARSRCIKPNRFDTKRSTQSKDLLDGLRRAAPRCSPRPRAAAEQLRAVHSCHGRA